MLRRVLNRISSGTEAVVSVDSYTGRIVMDIGSAFSRDIYLAAHVTAVPYDEGIWDFYLYYTILSIVIYFDKFIFKLYFAIPFLHYAI